MIWVIKEFFIATSMLFKDFADSLSAYLPVCLIACLPASLSVFQSVHVLKCDPLKNV